MKAKDVEVAVASTILRTGKSQVELELALVQSLPIYKEILEDMGGWRSLLKWAMEILIRAVIKYLQRQGWDIE